MTPKNQDRAIRASCPVKPNLVAIQGPMNMEKEQPTIAMNTACLKEVLRLSEKMSIGTREPQTPARMDHAFNMVIKERVVDSDIM